MPFFRNRVTRWLSGVLICGLLILVVGFVFRASILTGLAQAWIVDEPVAKADAIVVLGGGLECRPFAAARLFTNGTAPVILVAQPQISPTQELGLAPPDALTARKVMVQMGVPESAIQALGTNVTSTRDEAMAFRQWAVDHQARSVLIPTDIFHTRRARWIFEKSLAGTGVQVYMSPIPLPRYNATNWWREEEGLITMQNEAIKSVFYWIKY